MRRLLVYGALLMIFVRFAFIPEFLAFLTGVDWRLLYFIAPPVLAGVLLTGGIQRTFRQRAAFFWLGFLVWMVLATPWSFWKGGSARVVFAYARADIPMLFVTAGLAMTWKECKWIMHTIALSAVFNLVTTRWLLTDADARLGLGVAGSSIGDSNDLAAHLLLVLPFLLLVALSAQRSFVLRLAALGGCLYGMRIVLGAGSRGAFLALLVVWAFALFRGSSRVRLVGAMIAPIALAVLFLAMPEQTLNRITAFSADANATPEALEAVESQQARLYLLKQSILITIQNPVFGVGPGQFSDYEGAVSQNLGRRGAWRSTHNMITQVSSECGIPAVLLFLAAVVSTYRALRRIYQRAQGQPRYQDIAISTFCVMLALVGFCTAATFLTLAYRFYLPAISGLAIAILAAAEREFQREGGSAG